MNYDSLSVPLTSPISFGTGFASLLGGSAAKNGTSVGVADVSDGPPAYVGIEFRDSCPRLPETGDPVDLSQSNTQRYGQLKTTLTLTSTSCTAYFNSSPSRAVIYDEIAPAVGRQKAFDGPRTRMSRFDAGVYWATATEGDRNILKRAPVRQIFAEDKGVKAAAQGVRFPNGDPASSVYVNTNPLALSLFSPADLLHEALHNVTGDSDSQLAGRLGVTVSRTDTTAISRVLVSNGCAPR